MPDAKISELSAATTPLAGTEPLVLVQSGVTKKIASSYFLDAANLTGSLAAGRMPAYTGDVTSSAGAVALTLATVNSNVGSFGSATATPTFTVNGKGLITAAGSTTITPAWSSITSKPTTLAGYGITDAASLGANTFTGQQYVNTSGTQILAGSGNGYLMLAQRQSPTENIASVGCGYSSISLQLGYGVKTSASAASYVSSYSGSLGRSLIDLNGDILFLTAATQATTVDTAITMSERMKIAANGTVTIAGNTVWHAGNDGAGSGLDSDLLDGQSGAYYLDSANFTGTLAAGRMPAYTGDATSSAGAVALTLATVNSNVGTIGSATLAPVFTVNAKGLITSASNVTITPAWSSITSKPTTLAGYGITDAAASTHSHAATDITSGTLPAARMPALTGDVTTSAGAVASTLATVNANVGSFGSATAAGTFTVNAKGLITAASSVTITPAWSSITSKPTTLSGYAISDGAPLASPTFTGTPAAPTATAGTSTTQLATTAFVTTADNLKANLASPTFTGTVTMPAFSITSDARLKSSVVALEGHGDLIDATNVYSFIKDGKPQFGVIAQDAQAVRPEIVSTIPHDEFGEVLTVNPMDYLFALLAEMKELRKRVVELESR